MEPFTLDFEKVDCGHCTAGHACHTHSSGAAQGTNTSIHDAVNLAWKLGSTVKCWYSPQVLEKYDLERRPAAQYLTQPDKRFSAAISGEIPAEYREVYKDANELFSKFFNETILFNIGLGIYYETNILNKPCSSGMVTSDWHGPDTLVYTAGSRIPSRLYHHSRNLGNWWVLLFAGRSPTTRLKLEEAILQLLKILNHLPDGLVKSLTLVANSYNEATAVFNVPHAGDVLYDAHVSAHTAYGVSAEVGAIILLRPDGTLAFATLLESAGEVGPYFEAFTN